MVKKIPKRYTVTAALIYANGPIHIGHLAGCYLPADIYVRFLRKMGREVIFISGTDEHGVPITIKARKEKTTPQEIVDKYYASIKKSFAEFGISFDIYSRTTHEAHYKFSQSFFLDLHKKGIFEEIETEQFYDPVANQFLADRYICGTCPHCGYEQAYGDQCEKCGSALSPHELIQPRSTVSGEKPILKKTKNWYLPLDKFQQKIENYIQQHTDWKPNVYGQCISWIKQGLQARAMTRDLDWGVPVPLDHATGKVLYVWFDAPLGYITFTKELFENKQEPNEIYPKLDPFQNKTFNGSWEDFWKDTNTKIVHFIGKDNIVFHCIIFPAMLMAEGSYTLPDNVPANEFMNLEGEKISTSRNWAIWLHEYLEDFPNQQDVLRYVLCANAPETKDNDFTWKDFQLKNNSELVAILGNFVNRVAVLIHKFYSGKVPILENALSNEFLSVIESISIQKNKIIDNLENFKFREALYNLMELARIGNKFLADSEPWQLIKKNENKNRVAEIMFTCVQLCGALTHLMEPFLPFTAQKMARMFNISLQKWDNLSTTPIPSGHEIQAPELLFSKIEDSVIEKQIMKLKQTKLNLENHRSLPSSLNKNMETVSYEHFSKMDIRVGKIIKAEIVPQTQKLMKLIIDTGQEQKTIVSGIAEHYKPEDCLGKKICYIANLEPRKIKGILSEGMILTAQNANGKLSFLIPQEDFIQVGDKIA